MDLIDMSLKPKIFLREIKYEPVEMELDNKTPWMKEMLELAAPDVKLTLISTKEWAESSQYSAQLRLEKLEAGSDICVSGSIEAKVPIDRNLLF